MTPSRVSCTAAWWLESRWALMSRTDETGGGTKVPALAVFRWWCWSERSEQLRLAVMREPHWDLRAMSLTIPRQNTLMDQCSRQASGDKLSLYISEGRPRRLISQSQLLWKPATSADGSTDSLHIRLASLKRGRPCEPDDSSWSSASSFTAQVHPRPSLLSHLTQS